MTDSTASAAISAPIEGGRLRYIDALRGIAAVLVLWLHVANSYRAMSPQTEAHARWLNDFISQIDIGRIGVVVFFLISGFVIPFSIKPASAAPVAGFVIRRVFRIYPAYWLSVPLAAWVFYWTDRHAVWCRRFPRQPDAAAGRLRRASGRGRVLDAAGRIRLLRAVHRAVALPQPVFRAPHCGAVGVARTRAFIRHVHAVARAAGHQRQRIILAAEHVGHAVGHAVQARSVGCRQRSHRRVGAARIGDFLCARLADRRNAGNPLVAQLHRFRMRSDSSFSSQARASCASKRV